MRGAIATVVCACCVMVQAGLVGASRQQDKNTAPPAPDTVESIRRALTGTWTLGRLEVISQDVRMVVQSRGTLVYDETGNLKVDAKVDDPRLLNGVVLNYTGHIGIDPVKHHFFPSDVQSDRPADPSKIAPIALDKIRRFELKGDMLTVTYLNTLGRATAVAVWRRGSL